MKTEELKVYLGKLKRAELIKFILLQNLVMSTKPYRVMHPTKHSKTKFELVLDDRSTRGEVYRLLFDFVKDIAKRTI